MKEREDFVVEVLNMGDPMDKGDIFELLSAKMREKEHVRRAAGR